MSEISRKKALNTAANVLTYKNRSRAALIERLLEKDIDEDDAIYAVDRLCQLGLMDDASYASELVHMLCARGYGAIRIRRVLREKQLENSDIEIAMETYEPRADKINAFIRSKISGDEPTWAELKKISDGLSRRGFSWDEIRTATREYIDNLEDASDD